MVQLYEDWVEKYPIVSLEHGVAESDAAGWRLLTDRLGGRVQQVGDDNFVTSSKMLAEGIANAIIIELNQVMNRTREFPLARSREARLRDLVGP